MFAILFVISTVGHYLVIWAMYLERKFELEEVLFSQMKRKHEKEMKVGDGGCLRHGTSLSLPLSPSLPLLCIN